MKEYRSAVSDLFMATDPSGAFHVIVQHTGFNRLGPTDIWRPAWTRYATKQGMTVERISKTEFVAHKPPHTVLTLGRTGHSDSISIGMQLDA